MKKNLLYAIAVIAAMTAGIFTFNSIKYDIETIGGQKIKFASLQNKTIVVNYFAEWCAPCLREVPELNEFYEKQSESVLLLAISYDDLSREKLKEIQSKYKFEFPIVANINEPLPFEKPEYLPATFLLNTSGDFKGPLLGEQTADGLATAVREFQR